MLSLAKRVGEGICVVHRSDTVAADPLSLSITHTHTPQRRQKQGFKLSSLQVKSGANRDTMVKQHHSDKTGTRGRTHARTHAVYSLRDSSPCTQSLLAHLSTARTLAVHPSPAERSSGTSLAPCDTLNLRPLIVIASGCHLNSSTDRDGAIWQQGRDAAGKTSVCVKITITRQDWDSSGNINRYR